MSRARRDRRAQGRQEERSLRGNYVLEEFRAKSIIADAGEDDRLYPELFGRAVWTQPDDYDDDAWYWLVNTDDMRDFLGRTSPWLHERRKLQEELREEKRAANWLRRELDAQDEKITRMHAETERLRESLQEERRTNEKLRIDMAEAKRDADRARVDASSLQQKLRETETAFTEAKNSSYRHLIWCRVYSR